MASEHLIYNPNSFKVFNPLSLYKITAVLRVPSSSMPGVGSVFLRIGLIGSRVASGGGADLVIAGGNYILSQATTGAFYHCYNERVSAIPSIAGDKWMTLEGYTSNKYAILGNEQGTSAVGTLQNPGRIYSNGTSASATYIAPVIYINNTAGSPFNIEFDSIILEDLTTSISANGITTGAITTAVLTVGNNIQIDGVNNRMLFSKSGSAGTADIVTLGQLSANNSGILIKNSTGTEVFRVDEGGTAQISNLLMTGAITWNATALTNAAGKGPLTSITSTGIYSGAISAEQMTTGTLAASNSIRVGNGGLLGGTEAAGSAFKLWVDNADSKAKFYIGSTAASGTATGPGFMHFDGTTLKIGGNVDLSAGQESMLSWKQLNNIPPDSANVVLKNVVIDADPYPIKATFARATTGYSSERQWFSVNTPRMEPGKFGKAIMIEETSTNYCLYSENYSGPAWQQAGGTTVSGKNITVGASGADRAFYQIIPAGTDAANITISADFSGIPGNKINMYFLNSGGLLGAGKQITLTEIPTRHSVSTGGVTGSCWFYISTAPYCGISTSGTFSQTFTMDRPQAELKPYATSYIPTTTTAVQRGVETLGVTSVSSFLSFNEGTVECWFKPTSAFFRASSWNRIWGHSTSTDQNEIQLMRNASSNYVSFAISNSAGVPSSNWNGAMSTTQLVEDKFYHIVCTWSVPNNRFTIYINGKKEGEVIGLTNRPSAYGLFDIGHHSYIDRHSNGFIDDFRVSTYERTATEILASYNSKVPNISDVKTTLLLPFNSGETWTDTTTKIVKIFDGVKWVESSSHGAPNGTNVGSTPALTVESNSATGALAFIGTTDLRTKQSPQYNGTLSTPTQLATADGNIVVSLPYTYTQGSPQADLLNIYRKEGGSPVLTTDECFSTSPTGSTAIFVCKPNQQYSFAMNAVRRAEGGTYATTMSAVVGITTSGSNFSGGLDRNTPFVVNKKPTLICARGDAQNFVSNANRIKSTLGYDVLIASPASAGYGWTLAQCLPYDIIIVDYNAWSATPMDAFVKQAFDAGRKVIVFGNDTSSMFYITSTAVAAPLGTRQVTQTSHPTYTGWNTATGLTTETDNGYIITGVIPEAVVLSKHTSGGSVADIFYITNNIGGIVLHCQSMMAFGPAEQDKFLKNLIEFVAGNLVTNITSTGFIGNSSGTTLVSNAASGLAVYNATVAFRNTSPPSNSANGISVTPTSTTDGNILASLSYSYNQGSPTADQLLIYRRKGGGQPTVTDECFSTSPTGGTAIFYCEPGTVYSFAIQAIRTSSDGIEAGAISAYVTMSAQVSNYTGNINNVLAATLTSQAASAINFITDISSDDKITTSEKERFLIEWRKIYDEYSGIVARATDFGIITTPYVNSYNLIYTKLGGVPYTTPSSIVSAMTSGAITAWIKNPTTLDMGAGQGEVVRTLFQNYYTQRTNIISDTVSAASTMATGLKLGGTNLLANSRNFNPASPEVIWTATNPNVAVAPNGNASIFQLSPGGGVVLDFFVTFPNLPYVGITDDKKDNHYTTKNTVVGQIYTISFEYLTNYSGTFQYSPDYAGTTYSSLSIPVNTVVYKRVSLSCTAASTSTNHKIAFTSSSATNGTYFGIKNIKIEESNIATAWSEAPEDANFMLSRITSDTYFTKIEKQEIAKWREGLWQEVWTIEENGFTVGYNPPTTISTLLTLLGDAIDADPYFASILTDTKLPNGEMAQLKTLINTFITAYTEYKKIISDKIAKLATSPYKPKTFTQKTNPYSINTIFSRASTAMSKNGILAVDAPRIEQGKYGHAILIESAATNLVIYDTDNPLFVAGSDGLGGVSLIRSTECPYSGSYSIKYRHTSGSNNIYLNTSAYITQTVSTTFTFSVKIKKSDGLPITGLYSYLYINSYANDGTSPIVTPLEDGWHSYIVSRAVTGAQPCTLIGFSGLPTGEDIYLDDWQLEATPYATSYVLGTRAIESLSLSAGSISPSGGSISLWAKLDTTKLPQYARLFSTYTSAGKRLTLYYDSTTQSKIQLAVGDNIGTTTLPGDGVWILDDNWHLYTVNWVKGSYVNWYLDEDLMFESGFNVQPGVAPLYIGCNGDGFYLCNGLIDNFRITGLMRTGAEIRSEYRSLLPPPTIPNTIALLEFNKGDIWVDNTISPSVTTKTFDGVKWVESSTHGTPLGAYFANTKIDDFISDNYITQPEKPAIFKEWQDIYYQYQNDLLPLTNNTAATVNVPLWGTGGIASVGKILGLTEETAFSSAYTTLYVYCTGASTLNISSPPTSANGAAWIANTSSISIVPALLRSNFGNYYSTREKLIDRLRNVNFTGDGDAERYGFNPLFSLWTTGGSNDLPFGWTYGSGAYPSRNTNSLYIKTGTSSVKYICAGSISSYISRQFNFGTVESGAPLNSKDFIEGSVDIFNYSMTGSSSVPGVMVRVFKTNACVYSASLSACEDFLSPSTSGYGWNTVNFTVRIGINERIYGIQIFLMASYNGSGATYTNGTVYYDNLKFNIRSGGTDDRLSSETAGRTIIEPSTGNMIIGANGYIRGGTKVVADGSGVGILYGVTAASAVMFNIGNGSNAELSSAVTAKKGILWDGGNSKLYVRGELNADDIVSGTLVGRTISGGSITIGSGFSVNASGKMTCTGADIRGTLNAADIRAIGDLTNLIIKPYFIDATIGTWVGITSSSSGNAAGGPRTFSGKSGISATYEDYATINTRVLCTAGDNFSLSGWLRATDCIGDGCLGIWWYNSSATKLSESWCTTRNHYGTSWEKLEFTTVAPSGASFCVAIVHQSMWREATSFTATWPGDNTSSWLYFSDIRLTKQGVINADLINAGTINASLIKTGTLDASVITIANDPIGKSIVIPITDGTFTSTAFNKTFTIDAAYVGKVHTLTLYAPIISYNSQNAGINGVYKVTKGGTWIGGTYFFANYGWSSTYGANKVSTINITFIFTPSSSGTHQFESEGTIMAESTNLGFQGAVITIHSFGR